MNVLPRKYRWLLLLLLIGTSGWLWAEQRFPPPDFESPYKLPQLQRPTSNLPPGWLQVLDVVLLTAALLVATFLVLKRRSRGWIVVLSIACLAYFGFYRAGCVCPIGATQNVTRGIFDSTYYVPVTVILFFSIPLVFALLVGRVFCGGVCWLGAIQDLVLIKPVKVPRWLQKALRVLPFLYLGATVLFAATGALFIICTYDPFVPFFRLAAPFTMFVAGGAVLLLSTFVGRPYCRYLCPYGAILGLLSRLSWKNVTITPDECVQCGLCEDACPFGAIEPANVQGEGEEE